MALVVGNRVAVTPAYVETFSPDRRAVIAARLGVIESIRCGWLAGVLFDDGRRLTLNIGSLRSARQVEAVS